MAEAVVYSPTGSSEGSEMLSVNDARSRRGAYEEQGELRSCKNSVLLLVDFLGFSRDVKRAAGEKEDDTLLNRVGSFLDQWEEVLIDRYGLPGGTRAWEVRLFTDNIVISRPLRDSGDAEVASLLDTLGLFQISAALTGFFLRGGIAVGPAYVDDRIVFGLPLIEAHECESKVATNPRVVMAPSARKFLADRAGVRAGRRRGAYWHDVIVDEDGELVFNYLDSSFHDHTDPPEFEWIAQHRDMVRDRLLTFGDDPRVRTKYEWAARYHNFWCSSWQLSATYAVDGHDPLRAKRIDDFDDLMLTGQA